MIVRFLVVVAMVLTMNVAQTFASNYSIEPSVTKTADAGSTTTQDIPVYALSEVIPSASAEKVPDFTWVDENGITQKFSEVSKNKVVFLNFWATWCGPCRREVPDICELKKEFPDKDVAIIGIALDKDDNNGKALDKVKKFIKDRNVNYTIILGDLDLIEAFGADKIQSIPTTFIIDRKGNYPESAIIGARSKDQFGSAIKEKMN